MKLGSIVLAGVCGMVGLVAGRAGRPVPAEAVAAPVRVEPTRVIAAPRVLEIETAPVAEDEDTEGVDIGEALAHAQAAAAAHVWDHNAIRGKISERGVGAVAGATVVLSAPNAPTEVVITDEQGDYFLSNVRAGSYTFTVYYGDHTEEQYGVAVSDVAMTIQDHELDLSTPPPPPSNDYLINVPVPGRTFESVIGAAADAQGDDLGVSFSGGTYLENTYEVIID